MQKVEMPIWFFSVGSVVNIEYPFEDTTNRKIRPAVIAEIIDNHFTVVLLKITSSKKYMNSTKYPYAYKLKDIISAGLAKESWVLTDKELSVNGNNKLYLRGRLSEKDLESVQGLHNVAAINNCIIRLNYD